MDRLFMRVVRLGQAAQKHCHSGDVLIGLSELWEIVPLSRVLRWSQRARLRAQFGLHHIKQKLIIINTAPSSLNKKYGVCSGSNFLLYQGLTDTVRLFS